MKIINCEQYSDEWWAARRGLPTASAFNTIITPTGKPSTQFTKYACELIAEVVSKENEERFEPSEWMLRGTLFEEEARNWFSMKHQREVKQVGLMVNDEGTYGCSPDGLIADDCGLEIKCPKASTHVAYLLKGVLPDAYKPQVHGQLLVSGFPKWVFCSYHPDFAEQLIVEVTPDEYTEKLKAAVDDFVIKLDEMRRRIIK